MFNEPEGSNGFLCEYVSKITTCLRDVSNTSIVDFDGSLEDQAQQAYQADYVLLAHNGSAEPVFNYANLAAQKLFEMNWDEFTNLPSKYSAEADERDARERFLKEVELNGFSKNYSGIRISKTGKRFRIKDVLLWNVYDQNGDQIGQAAMFNKVEFL